MMQLPKHTDLIIWFTCLSVLPTGQASTTDLQSRINAIVRSYPSVNFSIHVVRAKDGKQIYAYRAKQALIPASNMKLVTTAAALDLLGPEFTYITRVYLWDANLVIIGSGDPLLADRKTDARYGRGPGWVLEQIRSALARIQINSIQDIILDTSVFDDQRVHPNWPADQLNRWYGAEVCGLNYNCNCVAITVRRDTDKVLASVDPATAYVTVLNMVQPISSGRGAVAAYRQPDQPNKIILKGTCQRQEGPFDVAIERPALLFGMLLAESLARSGIQVRGRLREGGLSPQGPLRDLCQFQTGIKDCLLRANKDSLGLAADCLFKTIGRRCQPTQPGSWTTGQQAIGQYLLSLAIEPNQFQIDDGSGLSRNNRLSAYCLTRLLYHQYNGPYWDLFSSSLAVGGVDGTLQRYFGQAPYKGKVLAKTGYLAAVRCLSGICRTATGDVLFAIIANETGQSSRPAINQIVQAILDNG